MIGFDPDANMAAGKAKAAIRIPVSARQAYRELGTPVLLCNDVLTR
jgi:hypothetical protein